MRSVSSINLSVTPIHRKLRHQLSRNAIIVVVLTRQRKLYLYLKSNNQNAPNRTGLILTHIAYEPDQADEITAADMPFAVWHGGWTLYEHVQTNPGFLLGMEVSSITSWRQREISLNRYKFLKMLRQAFIFNFRNTFFYRRLDKTRVILRV
jgi:hypothetical protein